MGKASLTHILWRAIPGKSYASIVSAGHPSIGYHDDGCRSISIELAEKASELKAENERLQKVIEEFRTLRKDIETKPYGPGYKRAGKDIGLILDALDAE